MAVGDQAAERSEKEGRRLLTEGRDPEPERRAGEAIHEPALRDRLRPGADERHELARNEQSIVSALESQPKAGPSKGRVRHWISATEATRGDPRRAGDSGIPLWARRNAYRRGQMLVQLDASRGEGGGSGAGAGRDPTWPLKDKHWLKMRLDGSSRARYRALGRRFQREWTLRALLPGRSRRRPARVTSFARPRGTLHEDTPCCRADCHPDSDARRLREHQDQRCSSERRRGDAALVRGVHGSGTSDCSTAEMDTAAKMETPCASLTFIPIPLTDGGAYGPVTIPAGPYAGRIDVEPGRRHAVREPRQQLRTRLPPDRCRHVHGAGVGQRPDPEPQGSRPLALHDLPAGVHEGR